MLGQLPPSAQTTMKFLPDRSPASTKKPAPEIPARAMLTDHVSLRILTHSLSPVKGGCPPARTLRRHILTPASL